MSMLQKRQDTLPDTNKKHYLTGMTALNIPSPDGTSGDWHFHEAFYGRGERKPKIFLAGEGESLNTNDILNDFGIYECSDILRKMGIIIPEGKKIYTANHYRAILDMLYRCVKILKSSPSYLEIGDWLDNEQQQKILLENLPKLKPSLDDKEWKIIQNWLLQQV